MLLRMLTLLLWFFVFVFFWSLALDKALSEEHARFTEELANMEGRLNDVRREHTKAVVALRQAERQVRLSHAPYSAVTSILSQRLLHKMINSRPFSSSHLRVR